jgi:DNA repair protein RadC
MEVPSPAEYVEYNPVEGETTRVVRLESFERSPRMAEIKAVYRSRTRRAERTRLSNPETAAHYLRASWNKDTIELIEDFLIVCLDPTNRAIGWVKVSSGGFDLVQVDLRVIFSLALQVGASALILAHNHPSDEVEPSSRDLQLTKQICDAGQLLNIVVLDHIILGTEGYFSFCEHLLL